MIKTTKQKLLSCFMATAFVLSSTLTPFVANAATSNASGSVTRIGGIDRFETAALMAQKGWKGTSDSVVLSAGMNNNLVDALAAGPLAYKLNAPILLTDGGQTLNAHAKAELQRLKPKKAYITSGTGVIKPSVIEDLKAMGITPVVLGGLDRYETSVNIAKELKLQGVDITRVVFAAAWATPADALSVSSIAAAQGMPILATSKDQLPASVKTYLDTIKDNVKDSYVIGGPGVISDSVKGALPGKVNRYSGLNRYDTNVQVLKNFAKEYKNDKVYVANGSSLVDAVAGVPLAAADGAAVVLVTQQIDNATKEFVKLNMSTDDMIVLGGEGAVLAAGMNSLTSAVSYATDSATVGSTSATLLELTDNVRLTGDNLTLQNAKANYSLYVKGDNITLNNVKVRGTVFVDPGINGSATLDGVTAEKIVILSGAKDSIHIKNTNAGVLTVDSSSNVRVEATGTTSIGATVVRTFSVLDANGGSMGVVTITSTPGQDPVVELRGTFTEPVVVEGQSTVRAAVGSSIAKLQFEPKDTTQKVTLEGTFKSVEANKEGNLNLGASAVVTDLITNVKTNLNAEAGAKVSNFDNRGNTVNLTGPTGIIPDSKPITPTPTPPGPGPGPSATTLTVSSVAALVNGIAESPTAGTYNFNLSTRADSSMITGLQLLSNVSNPDLVISSIRARDVEWVKSGSTIRTTIPTDGKISIGAILGGLDQGNNGISLSNFRFIFGNKDVVIKGKITKTGNYTDSAQITVTITLGSGLSPVTKVNNSWMIIERTTPKNVKVTVKSGQGDVTLGYISDQNGGNFNFAQVVTAIAIGEVNYSGGTQTAEQLQNAIALESLFNAVKLSQLVGKTIKFGGVNNNEFSVSFVAE